MKFDLNAPILPSMGAAGISLGASITELTQKNNFLSDNYFKRLESDYIVYRFESVTLWTTDSLVSQISVHNKYRGKLLNDIHIGIPKSSVEKKYGSFVLDIEDNLIIGSINGVCFEFDVESAVGEITEIFVYDRYIK